MNRNFMMVHAGAAAFAACLACSGAWAQAPASAPATLQERLDRLCQRLEQQRQSMHIPGLALSIVKDDVVILSRGFGVRDVEQNLPVTDETLFAIGSSTKAFTATAIGMLIDEGKMSWEDPPSKHLPGFKISDGAANEQLTIRDLLCHRSGLSRSDLLWASAQVGRDEILRTVAAAELTSPFREKFHYNNVMFLAAGEAAGRAAGTDWDTLISERLLGPLGMRDSTTFYEVVQNNPLLAKGYIWNADTSAFEHQPMRNLANIAPAGAINSSARDMARWVRFQLAQGTIDGQRLISADRIDETWHPQIPVEGNVSYGLGWMVGEWNGRRLIQHGGNIDGFGAAVAFLPEDGVGFALLTNVTATPLQSTSINMIFDALLGDFAEEGAVDPVAVQRYLGKYHFEALKTDVTVLMQDGTLAVDVPGQMVFQLKPPDAQGIWQFDFPQPIAVSFNTNQRGETTGMTLYQAGLEFELPREGVTAPIEISLDDARKYLGAFRSDELNGDVKVLHRNGRLAVDVPGQMIFELHLPDADGKWAFRAKKTIQVSFNAAESGAIESMTLFQDGRVMQLPRSADAPAGAQLANGALSIQEVLALHDRAYGTARLDALGAVRMEGSLRFVHQGVSGRIETLAHGDKFKVDIDLGKFGFIKTAASGDRGWSSSAFDGFDELTGERLDQMRLQHPLLVASDWTRTFQKVALARVEADGEKTVYVVNLAAADDVACTMFLDGSTGLVDKAEIQVPVKGIGSIRSIVTFLEHREVDGVRIPVRYEAKNEFNGRLDVEISAITANVQALGDAFILTPDAP